VRRAGLAQVELGTVGLHSHDQLTVGIELGQWEARVRHRLAHAAVATELALAGGAQDRIGLDVGGELVGRREMADMGIQELAAGAPGERDALVAVHHEIGAVDADHIDRLIDADGVRAFDLADAFGERPLEGMPAAIEVSGTVHRPHDLGHGDRLGALADRGTQVELTADPAQLKQVAASVITTGQAHARTILLRAEQSRSEPANGSAW
jgi:hypothetical protein